MLFYIIIPSKGLVCARAYASAYANLIRLPKRKLTFIYSRCHLIKILDCNNRLMTPAMLITPSRNAWRRWGRSFPP